MSLHRYHCKFMPTTTDKFAKLGKKQKAEFRIELSGFLENVCYLVAAKTHRTYRATESIFDSCHALYKYHSTNNHIVVTHSWPISKSYIT